MNTIQMKSGIKGEYKYTLRGSDGRIKQECDWLPNTLLDGALYALTIATNWPTSSGNTFNHMYVGDSDAVTAITQTGLQGTDLGYQGNWNSSSGLTPTAPDWEHITLISFKFEEGNGTGLIKEFGIFRYTAGPVTGGSVRVVLDAPINKGANDELIIEHRLTWYPNLNDVTGVIDISGVNYDYECRHANLGDTYGGHPFNFNLDHSTSFDWTGLYDEASLFALGDVPSNRVATTEGQIMSYGGSFGNYYSNAEMILDVDAANGITFNLVYLAYRRTRGGVQCRFTRQSDGASFTKENTHEFRFNMRTYPQRYVP